MVISNTYVAYTNMANAISFALFNQKEYYNRKHQSLFMNVEDWAILKLHKGYFISFFVSVTKKLT